MKTGSYTIGGPLLIGAALAGGSPELDERLSRYAAPLGEAFQVRDDVGVLEEEGDLAQGRPTVVLAKAGELVGPERRQALAALGPAEMAGALRESGALDAAIAHANGLVDEALAALARGGSRPSPRRRSRSSPRSSRSGILSMMEAELTPTLRRTFSDLAGASLATVGPDGAPHVAPAWFVWREDAIYLSTRRGSRSWLNGARPARLRRHRSGPRVGRAVRRCPRGLGRGGVGRAGLDAGHHVGVAPEVPIAALGRRLRAVREIGAWSWASSSCPSDSTPGTIASDLRRDARLPTCCPPVADPGPWV